MNIVILLGILGIAVYILLVLNEFENRNKERRSREYDGKYCTECGNSTYLKPFIGGYDARTGDAIMMKKRYCSISRGSYEPDEVHHTYEDM